MVVAGIIPDHLLAEERTTMYLSRDAHSTSSIEVRKATLDKWQSEWRIADKGLWTKKLISDVRPWVARKHGSVGFHLAQMFTGHGCFRLYLVVQARARDGDRL